MGLEIGLKPMQTLQNIAVINNRPCLWGNGALAVIQTSGQLEDIDETLEGDLEKDAIATCIVKRKGMKSAIKRTFSIAEARKARLLSKPGFCKTIEAVCYRCELEALLCEMVLQIFLKD